MTDVTKGKQIEVDVTNLVPRYTRETDPNKMSDSEFAALKALMKTDGSLETILITLKQGTKDTYLIINGHHRYWAAQDIEMKKLPAMLISANKAKAILLGIGMNRIRGDLDLSLAGSEIQEVMEASSKITMEQIAINTGLSVEEIEALTQQAGEGADDLLEELGDDMKGGTDDDDENVNLKPFVLEIQFPDRDTYKLARRKLKRAAGKGGDLARGLLTLLGEDDAT